MNLFKTIRYFTKDWKISSNNGEDWIFTKRDNSGGWFSMTATERYMAATYGPGRNGQA